MCTRATTTGKRVGLRSAWLLGIVMILLYSPAVWATTYLKNQDIEVQAWYRMRQSFQTDGKEHFDWVQWRNEAFIWGIWHNFVRNGQLLDNVPIPFVHSAEINARYQARVDPVYYLREHYRHLYDAHQRSDFFKPQDLFRDLFIDLDHGDVGPGSLSSRWGYQTIVWGEMDLFRSLDVINPLRLDQSFGVGEKLDELRLPILAVKFLYNLGSIGESLSEVGIEAWFTPRYQDSNNHTHLIVEEGWRLPFQIRNCMTPDGKVHDYSPQNCANARKFLPYRPTWLNARREIHPWSIVRIGPNSLNDSQDYVCADYARGICAPDIPNERTSIIYNIPKGPNRKLPGGINFPRTVGGGVRLLGKTWFNMDFTLNYIYQPSGTWGTADLNKPTKVYGDFALPGMPLSGNFEEGLLHCLSPKGITNVGRPEQMQQNTILTGADLRGYDWPERRLDANGAPLPSAKEKQAKRAPVTICTSSASSVLRWNHIVGFTLTYNDFDYTGAVFRLEESVTTPGHWHRWIGNPEHPEAAQKFPKVLYEMPVWRHGLGLDFAQGYGSYPGMKWMRNLPGDLGRFASTAQAVVLQWQMMYMPELANHLDPNMSVAGLRLRQLPPFRPGKQRPQWHHWNHVFSLVTAGIYKRYEQRMAVAFDPGPGQWFLFGQWYWHQFMGRPIDLSMGTAWYPVSRNDLSWVGLYLFGGRNLLWFEATYYLL